MIIEIAEFAERHLPAVVSLLNDEYRDDVEFIEFDEERVRSEIHNRRLRLLVAEENGKVVSLIATHSHEDSEHVTWIATGKGQDRRIIEDMLVKAVEKNAKSGSVMIMIDEGSPRIADWIKRGYTLQPGFQRMAAKLDGLKPVPKVGEDTTLRSLRADEEKEFVEAVNRGFGWKRLELGDLENWKVEDPPFTEEWVQVAEVGGRIVSTVVAKPDRDAMKYLHLNRGYLGPAVTLPEFRNRHLASALTARAMNFLYEKGMDSVILGTSEQNVSSIAMLRSLGFKVEKISKSLTLARASP